MLALSIIGGFLFATHHARLHGTLLDSYTKPWRAVVSATPAFSFFLPPNARHSVEDSYNIFSSEGALQNFYTVTLTTNTKNRASVEVVRSEIEKIVRTRPRNQLLETTATSLKGREATSFLIQDFDSGGYTRGYIVQYEEYVYTLAVLYPHNSFDVRGYKKFIASFTLGDGEE